MEEYYMRLILGLYCNWGGTKNRAKQYLKFIYIYRSRSSGSGCLLSYCYKSIKKNLHVGILLINVNWLLLISGWLSYLFSNQIINWLISTPPGLFNNIPQNPIVVSTWTIWSLWPACLKHWQLKRIKNKNKINSWKKKKKNWALIMNFEESHLFHCRSQKSTFGLMQSWGTQIVLGHGSH